MMSFRQKKISLLKRSFQFFLCAAVGVSVAACAKYPRYKIVQPTNAQLREDYKGLLEDTGVQVAVQGETVRVIVPTDELYEPRSANLKHSAYQVFNRIGGFLPLYNPASIKVAGYSDDRGSERYLRLLTARQAQVAVETLWPHGMGSSMAFAEGYGSAYPIASNESSTGRELNRRLEIGFKYYRTLRPYD